MIEGNDIICFSNDWDADPLSKKHIILRLGRKNRILWINGIGNRNPTVSARDIRRVFKKLWQFWQGCRRVEQNIFVFTPLVIPFHGSRMARWFNRHFYRWSIRRAARKLRFRNPITWAYAPSCGEVAGSLNERMIVYHCVDDFSKFTGADKAGIADLERKLLQKSDLVVVSADALYESKRREHRNTFLVPHGVDYDHFKKACLPETAVAEELRALPHPVIGFFGLVADWVDLSVIQYLATKRPDWSIVLVGEIQTDVSSLRELPNVHLLGRRNYQNLPGYSKGFDVAILPFVVNDLTLAASPLKMREYLAAGLPVVATPLPEVKKLSHLLRVASTPQEFLGQIEAYLADGRRGPDPELSREMQSQSWDARVEEISGLVSSLPGQRVGVIPEGYRADGVAGDHDLDSGVLLSRRP
jgi:glycosyltransferase involved in cell wall biosynthesis